MKVFLVIPEITSAEIDTARIKVFSRYGDAALYKAELFTKNYLTVYILEREVL